MGNGILGMSQGLLGSKALLAGGGEQVDFLFTDIRIRSLPFLDGTFI